MERGKKDNYSLQQFFTLMYGGIITHSFTTCKLHLKQSGKVPQTVL